MFLAALTAAALAHGPPAGVVGVGTADAEGPVHAPLTEGLAVRQGAGWRFVCPAVHGGLPAAPKVAGEPDVAWLPGADGLYGVDAVGSVWPVGVDGLSISAILGLVTDDAGGVFALTPDGTGRAIWDVVSGGVVWSGADALTGLAVFDGALEALAFDGDGVTRVRLALDGTELSRADLGAVTGTNPVPRAAGGTLYVVDRTTSTAALLRIEGNALQPVGPAAATILGPVQHADSTFAAFDGVLHRVDHDGTTTALADEGLTCLAAIDGAAWACADRGLFALDADGLAAEVLAPADVQVPDWSLVADDDLALCYSEWRVWATDVGVDPGPFPDGTTPPTEPEGPSAPAADPAAEVPGDPSGCGCAAPGPRPVLAFVPVLALFVARRRALGASGGV